MQFHLDKRTHVGTPRNVIPVDDEVELTISGTSDEFMMLRRALALASETTGEGEAHSEDTAERLFMELEAGSA